jgi:cobalamin biosynthesis protein CobT
MTIIGDPNPSANCSSNDDDVEDDTYMPSPRARPHGKGLASASSSRAATDEEEIEEEEDGRNENDGAEGDDDEEDEEEVFDVVEINPTSYIHMGTLVFRLPLNPDWREKISYKGKTDLVSEKWKENLRLVEKEHDIDYRFHTTFHQDFYEFVIITKTKHVAISQWIDWTYMEAKHAMIFDEVVAACRAKHLRDVMSFQKNWNTEIISQFYATLYVEERGDMRKFHWMIEGMQYEITFE